MDVLSAIKKRRSIRRFLRKDVGEEIIKEMLECAILAPSEGNLQPWRFYVIRNKELKEKIALYALRQEFIAEAPVCIVVCADLKRTSPYGERGRTLYCLQSTAAAIENMMLYAVSKGLGTCWVGAFDERKVADALSLPSYLRPVAIIPVGYPAEEPETPPRIPLRNVMEEIR
jgi:nitroreductase